MKAHGLLALLWIIFCFLHSLLAASGIKKLWHKARGQIAFYYRLVYNLFAFISLGTVVFYESKIQSPDILPRGGFFLAIGVILSAIGLCIMAVCITKYFPAMSGLKPESEIKQPVKLITDGIHKWVRHPLYLGTLSLIWGLFFFFPAVSVLLSNTIMTAYTLYGITLEEQKLLKEFGDLYSNYQKQVPKILPWLRKTNSLNGK